jgi:DNA-binding transcriptional LysR family regulator
MELRDLEYLLACVEAGSFTKASRQAHAAQPTLSHAVKRLEDELGHVLLTRPKARDGRVAPTAAGALLVDRARRIRALLASLESDLAALDGIVRGPLAIGAAPSLAMAFVPRLLARMLRDYPEVRISVDTGASEALVERVRAGVLDAALCADIPTRVAAGLAVETLFRERFVVVAGGSLPLGKRVRLAEIALGPLLLPSPDVFPGQRLREAFNAVGCGPLRPVAILGSAEALMAAARGGLGYALLPERCIEQREAGLRVAVISGPEVSRTVHLVTRRHAADNPTTVGFREAVKACIELGARSATRARAPRARRAR